MRILCLYNANQTYTEAVFEHVNSFHVHSKHSWEYLHHEHLNSLSIDLDYFDAIVVHYSVRLPFNQISESLAQQLISFHGLKILFIQDEYDNTNLTKYWISRIGFNLVFSVAPSASLDAIYPPSEFPNVRFVSVLTGYIPTNSSITNELIPVECSSHRPIAIGYRGRALPIRYGQLGREKISIGKNVKQYCVSNNVDHDIAWSEESRIYGPDWYKFIASCKAMLGSESGSNVFDWDGALDDRIKQYKRHKWLAKNEDIYRDVIAPLETHGLMNQVSPRIFEMASLRTAMILFEGEYSGIIQPETHYLSLKKDFSNLPDIVSFLHDEHAVDAMTSRVHNHLIASGEFGYQKFSALIDKEIATTKANLSTIINKDNTDSAPTETTQAPLKASPPLPHWVNNLVRSHLLRKFIFAAWAMIPIPVRPHIKRFLKHPQAKSLINRESK